MINIDLINTTPLKMQPFPYFTIEQSMLDKELMGLVQNFPIINSGGSFNKEDLELSEHYHSLHDSLDSDSFRQALSEKFKVNVITSPIMLTYRGHTDSKTKLLTILIYFNDGWAAQSGKLRILNSDDMNDIAEEVNPTAGSMVAFKVTDNCWHGYPSFEGTRNAIQVNFLANEAASKKHKFFHKISAKLKSL
jgi:SM-20-related protein